MRGNGWSQLYAGPSEQGDELRASPASAADPTDVPPEEQPAATLPTRPAATRLTDSRNTVLIDVGFPSHGLVGRARRLLDCF